MLNKLSSFEPPTAGTEDTVFSGLTLEQIFKAASRESGKKIVALSDLGKLSQDELTNVLQGELSVLQGESSNRFSLALLATQLLRMASTGNQGIKEGPDLFADMEREARTQIGFNFYFTGPMDLRGRLNDFADQLTYQNPEKSEFNAKTFVQVVTTPQIVGENRWKVSAIFATTVSVEQALEEIELLGEILGGDCGLPKPEVKCTQGKSAIASIYEIAARTRVEITHLSSSAGFTPEF